jgi:hypothetical protein
MKHEWYTRGDGHACGDNWECNLCALSWCKVCGLFEGGLPTDCPGEKISEALATKIYEEKLDYREAEGGWVNKFSPHMQSFIYGAVWDVLNGRSELSEPELRLKYGIPADELADFKSRCVKDGLIR